MKPLLPVVNSDVGFSIARHIGEANDRTFVKNELAAIAAENPAIANFIASWSMLGEEKLMSAFCGILVYKLLRSQAEVDRMEE